MQLIETKDVGNIDVPFSDTMNFLMRTEYDQVGLISTVRYSAQMSSSYLIPTSVFDFQDSDYSIIEAFVCSG